MPAHLSPIWGVPGPAPGGGAVFLGAHGSLAGVDSSDSCPMIIQALVKRWPGTKGPHPPPPPDPPPPRDANNDTLSTLCYAIVVPARKSAFRAGFWPDC